MPCLQKYRWVKLARTCDIPGKGILGAWARLAMHAAFRYGVAVSGGQSDVIRPGYWTGKMAELMRILDCRWGSVLPTLEKLSEYGYMSGISAPIRIEWTGILPCFRSDWWSRASLAGCPVGGVVLDPFFGSGTAGAVAKRLGRHYIGIDLNPVYCQAAEKRIREIPDGGE